MYHIFFSFKFKILIDSCVSHVLQFRPPQNQTSQSDTIEAVEETSGNIGDDNKMLVS